MVTFYNDCGCGFLVLVLSSISVEESLSTAGGIIKNSSRSVLSTLSLTVYNLYSSIISFITGGGINFILE